MRSHKIRLCIVGAGSSYTPELIEGILELPQNLEVGTINFHDINQHRLDIMTNLSKRMIGAKECNIEVNCSTDLERMLDGVDFVITQIRIGGMEGRYLDESIPLSYGIIGQETTGPGGMFKALRTIPYMLDIAHKVERFAPNAWILNYTNPSGIITEAVLRYGSSKIIGLCSGIPGMQAELVRKFEREFTGFESRCVGLNHLGFIHKYFSNGCDISNIIISRLIEEYSNRLSDNDAQAFAKLIETIEAFPIGYLNYYYFRSRELKKASIALQHGECRSQQVMKLEKEIFSEAVNTSVNYKPKALSRRGGEGYSSVTFAAMNGIWNNTGQHLAVSCRNSGAINFIEDDVVVEVVCSINANGAHPLVVGKIPIALRGLIQAVKAYESLVVEAAVHRSRRLALQAMLNHPLMGDIDICEQMLDKMLKAHGLVLN